MSARYTGGLVYNAPGGWSGLFNGSSQYLTVPDNAAFDLSTSAFTIEGWVYVTATSGSQQTLVAKGTGADNQASYHIALNGSNWVYYLSGNGSTWSIASNVTIGAYTINTWQHIALVRNGSVFTPYLNGVAGTTTTSATALFDSNKVFSIGADDATTQKLTGYISNVRLVKGTAVYTTNFTPPTGALQPITNTSLLTCRYPTFVDGSTNAFTITNNGTATVNTLNPFPTSQLPNPALGGAGNGVYTMSQYAALKAANLWPAYDPYYKNVTLNLHGNGTNAAQNNTFLDSSGNNYPITRGGNATQGTFSPYGPNWSNVFNATTDKLTLTGPNLSSYTNFTFECWVNFNGFGTDTKYFLAVSGGSYYQLVHDSSAGISLRVTGYTSVVGESSNAGWAIGTWYHVALVKNGSTYTIYKNGVSIATSTYTSALPSVTIGYIGGYDSTTGLNAYMSNTRITSTAVYTAAFTPPTVPLTAITNTLLLTSQSNRFVDNSASPYTLTVSGSPSTQRFSPFTTPYSASTIGGSTYFDGSSANLITTNTITTIGTQDFCLEAWVYCFSTTSYACIIGNATAGFFIEMGSARGIFLSGPEVSLGSAQYNRWFHVAYSRVSGTYAGWVNGVRQATGSFTTNLSTAAKIGINNYIDAGLQGYGTTGYIADGRVTVGSSPYSPSSTTITVPTAPLTAITGTVFLASMQNAAIFDNAMMNDLQTVGNAQISTSVVKYGTGSMYFDGTGDYLLARSNDVFNFGTGDFTVEFWINASASGSYTQVIGTIVSSNENGTWRIGNRFNSLNQIYFARGTGSGFNEFQASVNVNDGAWHHVAVVRYSGTITIYADGVASASSSITGTCTSANPLYVGYNGRDNAYITGYLDDVRITKGVARYTTNFTPPTSQVQDQ